MAVSRILLLALVGALLSACVGGGSDELHPPTPGPTPTRAAASDTDRAYARTVCSAFAAYLSAMGGATQQDPQLFTDQAKLVRIATPILERLAAALAKAKPPADTENFHTGVVQRVKRIAAKAKAGEVVSTADLAGFAKGAPLPPDTVRARLAEAAEDIPECQQRGGMDAFFGAPEGE